MKQSDEKLALLAFDLERAETRKVMANEQHNEVPVWQCNKHTFFSAPETTAPCCRDAWTTRRSPEAWHERLRVLAEEDAKAIAATHAAGVAEGREQVLAVVRRDLEDHREHRRTGWSFLRNILRECDESW